MKIVITFIDLIICLVYKREGPELWGLKDRHRLGNTDRVVSGLRLTKVLLKGIVRDWVVSCKTDTWEYW